MCFSYTSSLDSFSQVPRLPFLVRYLLFQISVFSHCVSVITYSRHHVSCWTPAVRRFPLRTFPFYRFNNYCQLHFLHFVTSVILWFAETFFANIIFRLIGILALPRRYLSVNLFFFTHLFSAQCLFYYFRYHMSSRNIITNTKFHF